MTLKEQLHPLEKKVLLNLERRTSIRELEKLCNLKEVEVMRAVQWLQSKKLIKVFVTPIKFVQLLNNQFKFIERKYLKQLLEKNLPIKDTDKIAVSWLLRRNWAIADNGFLKITEKGRGAIDKKQADELLYDSLRVGEKKLFPS